MRENNVCGTAVERRPRHLAMVFQGGLVGMIVV